MRLQKPQVHERRAAVVVAHRFVEPGAGDHEDRDPPPVRAAHLDALELAAADKPESPEEEVVGLKHWTLPWTARGEAGWLRRIEVGRLSSDLEPAPGGLPCLTRRRPAFPARNLDPRKPCQEAIVGF